MKKGIFWLATTFVVMCLGAFLFITTYVELFLPINTTTAQYQPAGKVSVMRSWSKYLVKVESKEYSDCYVLHPKDKKIYMSAVGYHHWPLVTGCNKDQLKGVPLDGVKNGGEIIKWENDSLIFHPYSSSTSSILVVF